MSIYHLNYKYTLIEILIYFSVCYYGAQIQTLYLQADVAALTPDIRLRTAEHTVLCTTCNTRVKFGNYSRHLLTHTIARPHKCNMCPSAFKRLDMLKRHNAGGCKG